MTQDEIAVMEGGKCFYMSVYYKTKIAFCQTNTRRISSIHLMPFAKLSYVMRLSMHGGNGEDGDKGNNPEIILQILLTELETFRESRH